MRTFAAAWSIWLELAVIGWDTDQPFVGSNSSNLPATGRFAWSMSVAGEATCCAALNHGPVQDTYRFGSLEWILLRTLNGPLESYRQQGVRSNGEPGTSFQYVPTIKSMSSSAGLFTHHLTQQELVRFLMWMEVNSLRGWFVNDLHRQQIPYRLMRVLVRLLPLHPCSVWVIRPPAQTCSPTCTTVERRRLFQSIWTSFGFSWAFKSIVKE
jgi:hypothetical protein